MRKIVKKIVLWQCQTCGTKYEKESDARTCERMPVEAKKFKVGDCVESVFEPRICGITHKTYRPKMKISGILGPEPPDQEYWIKWLGGLPKTHVYTYELVYTCPECKQKKSVIYFAPELQLITL